MLNGGREAYSRDIRWWICAKVGSSELDAILLFSRSVIPKSIPEHKHWPLEPIQFPSVCYCRDYRGEWDSKKDNLIDEPVRNYLAKVQRFDDIHRKWEHEKVCLDFLVRYSINSIHHPRYISNKGPKHMNSELKMIGVIFQMNMCLLFIFGTLLKNLV